MLPRKIQAYKKNTELKVPKDILDRSICSFDDETSKKTQIRSKKRAAKAVAKAVAKINSESATKSRPP